MDPTVEPALVALFTLALFVFGGLATYTRSERRHRHRWRRFAQRPVAPEHAPFRRAAGPAPTQTVQTQRRAPKTLRRTALWSIYMGQMALPGGLLGLIGVVYGGLGLISIPGMILAVRIWRLGYALLRGEPGAAQEARKLARFAIVLNLVAVVIGFAIMALGGIEFAVLTAVLTGYALVSVAHAKAMERCADLLDADHRAQAQAHGQTAPEQRGEAHTTPRPRAHA